MQTATTLRNAFPASPPEARLSMVDDILVTAGWRENRDGDWLPPQHWVEAIAVSHGRGHFARAIAIAFTVQADEARVSAQGRAA